MTGAGAVMSTGAGARAVVGGDTTSGGGESRQAPVTEVGMMGVGVVASTGAGTAADGDEVGGALHGGGGDGES
jgi:hypothetical protein